jgi:hypothetical protein
VKLNYDKGRNVSRDYQQEFRGINRKVRPSETEFVSAINLTSAEYPALTTRRERDFITDIGRCDTPSLCSLGDGSIAYIGKTEEGYAIFIDGVKEFALTDVEMPQKIVKMGQYLCLFPSGIVYNLTDKTAKSIESVFDNQFDGVFSFTPCKLDGKVAIVSALIPSKASIGDMWYDTEANKSYLCTAIVDGWQKEKAIVYVNNMDLAFATERPLYAVQASSFDGGIASGSAMLYTFNGGTYISTGISVTISDKFPTSASNGDFILITDSTARTNTLYQYRTKAPKWAEYPTSYTRISSDTKDITDFFKEGDVIEVSEFGYTRVYTAVKETADEVGYIVTDTLPVYGTYGYAEKPMQITRMMPKGLTNIVETSNRLWGTDTEGKEIYACKLGDPFNWYAYTGIASDAYAITVGSGGKFTAAVSYDGYPHFFKENSILKVYGHYPFNLYSFDCPGVALGNEKSVAILNGAVIYKGVSGFFAYSGGYPELLSDDITDICTDEYVVTAAAADNNAYYAAIQNGYDSYVYVFEKGFWHIHDAGKLQEYKRNAIADMCFTGRGVIAAIGEEETEYAGELEYQGFEAKRYLATLSGLPPKGFEADKKHEDLQWSMTSARLGLSLPQDKWYSHLIFRYASESPVDVVITYDGKVTDEYTLSARERLGSESIILSPTQSEYITISMKGKGKFTLVSISRNIEGGNTP